MGIWDVGGQISNMSPYRKRFYQGANFCLIAFDISMRKTFESIDHWLNDIKAEENSVPIALIATKMDLPNHEVTRDEIAQKAESLQCPFIFTSARTGNNVQDVFIYATHKFIEKL